MLSKSIRNKHGKLKASIEDFLDPLLKRLADCPQKEVVEEICELVGVLNNVVESSQMWDIEKISLFGEIERQIDYWKVNGNYESKLLDNLKKLSENFKKLLEKHGVDLSKVIARDPREGIPYIDAKTNITTLLNVNTKYLNSNEIKKILSAKKTKEIQVVQLGRWSCTSEVELDNKIVSKRQKYLDHIEVDNTDFLKKIGKKVSYLSLQGISGITELPKSIGKLSNLRILDLRSCHNLEKLPHKGVSRLRRGKKEWFKNLTHLDISECYLLNHMPKWICEISNLEVLKGFVVNSGRKKKRFCWLSDLSYLKKLRKLGIRIIKPLDPKYVSGLEYLDSLNVLTIIWSINELNNENDEVPIISFPKNLEKLDIRCYPGADVRNMLDHASLPYLKRLYLRGGKIRCYEWDRYHGSEIKILRLRFLEYLMIDWYEPFKMSEKLAYVEYEECPNLASFPRMTGGTWDRKRHGSFELTKTDLGSRVEIEIIDKGDIVAGLDENVQMLMLELTGGLYSDGPGLDLVVVLDVGINIKSENMLKKMKAAILFVINKLSCIDRFSIVMVSNEAKMLYPLQKMSKKFKKEVECMVDSLKVNDEVPDVHDHMTSNLKNVGLKMGLEILNDPKTEIGSKCHVKAIMLVSSVPINYSFRPHGNVAVHTFGFGDHDAWSLMMIAQDSLGGTYSDVSDTDNLTKAIAVCLAGLLTVVAQDLRLIITPIKGASTIKEVNAGSYLATDDASLVAGSKTVKFGDLYSREVRKVSVRLLLPAAANEGSAHVLDVSYSFMKSGIQYVPNNGTPSIIVSAKRLKTVPALRQRPWKAMAEVTRRVALERLYKRNQVRPKGLVDPGIVYSVLKFLKDARNDPLCERMRAELQQLLTIPISDKFPFELCLYNSHEAQRAAARGANIELSIMSFGSPLMFEFLHDAKKMSRVGYE